MLTSGFFNSVNGDRKYNAQNMTEYFEGLFSSGVVGNPTTSMQVQALSTPAMAVQVLAGKAFIDGYWAKNDGAVQLPIEAANVAVPRIDAIVLRLNLNEAARNITFQVITGTASDTPTAPDITRTDTIKDYLLATVYVGAGVTAINSGDITDQRASTDCGYVIVVGSDGDPAVINTIANGMYMATGTNDNIALSNLIQNFLTGGDDYKQLEIDVYGDLGISVPASTASNTATWFNFASASKTSRRVKLDFSHTTRISITAQASIKNVMFDTTNSNIEIANLQAAMYSTPNGSIFSGTSNPTVTESAFWLNGTGSQTLIGAYQGTFLDCRMSVTNNTGAAYGFSGNGNVLRLTNVEAIAMNASGSSNESVGVHVMGSQTTNVLLMTNCTCPLVTRSGYKQDNVVKVNSGYYSLVGNTLGKAALLYSTGTGKTEIGTIYYTGGGKTTIDTDATLAMEGIPADAKATGDQLSDLNQALNDLNLKPVKNLVQEMLAKTTNPVQEGVAVSLSDSATRALCVIPVVGGKKYSVNTFMSNNFSGFADGENKWIGAVNTYKVDDKNYVFEAPANATKLYLCNTGWTTSQGVVVLERNTVITTADGYTKANYPFNTVVRVDAEKPIEPYESDRYKVTGENVTYGGALPTFGGNTSASDPLSVSVARIYYKNQGKNGILYLSSDSLKNLSFSIAEQQALYFDLNTLTAYVDSIMSVANVTQLNKVILLWKQETTVKGEWAWLYYKQLADSSMQSSLALYDRCITKRLHSRQGEGFNYPDNSLEAIKATIKDGYHGIRIAVASTSDHVIYCTHSYELRNNKTLNLDYVTVASTGDVYDGDIQINNVTSSFIDSLLYKGYPIPTLESVFAFLNRFDLEVTLEVKERMGTADVTNMLDMCKYYMIDPVFSCDSYNVNDILAVSDDIHLETILEPYSKSLADTRYANLKDHCKSLRFGLIYGDTMPTKADVVEYHEKGVTYRTAGNQPTQSQFEDAIKWADVVEVRGDYQTWINRLVNETW